jgi:ABC-type bacteriocin/lantibiotic exporter with double-glycine peptidase domain
MSENVLTPVKRFLNLLKVDKHDILSIYVYALFNGILSLSIPLGIQAIINFLTVGEVSTSWIVLVVIVILGIALSGVMQIMQLVITENLQQKIFTRSAFEFAYRIPRIRLEVIDNQYVPELANRFFDTLNLQKGLSKIIMDFSSASLQVLFGLILLSFYHPFFIMYSLVLLLIVYIIFKFTVPQGLRTSLKESSYKYEVAHWLEEVARTTTTFKLAGETTLPLTKTDEKVKGYLTNRKSHFKTLLVQYINLVGFKILTAAGLLVIGGLLVINQQMNIGQFVASEIIIILVLNSVEKLILSMETIYDVLTATEKIGLVTDLELEKDKGEKLDQFDSGLTIKVKNLAYSFTNNSFPTIQDVNFELNQGQSLCISGESGSGKSFLLQVVAGLYDNFAGSIVINDYPIQSICKENLRTYIGDNLSKEDIFKATLYENISIGRLYVTKEKVLEAINVVGLSDFIETLPEGMDTVVLSEGKNLPKSIKLKIILARSIVGSPRLLLLEDNFKQLSDFDKDHFLN